MSYSLLEMRAWPSLGTLAEVIRRNYMSRHGHADFVGVYAVWCDETLLYVGYSSEIRTRIKKHFRQPAWGRRTDHYPTHATALRTATAVDAAALEAALIRVHSPPWNSRIEPEGGQVRGAA